jgi:prolyl oligopeptidase
MKLLLALLALPLLAQYPPARRGDTVDNLHGTKVADPYRWMEDVDSPETRAWVEAQVNFTNSWFAKIPNRAEIARELGAWTDVPSGGEARRFGRRVFFTERKPGQNQPVLYVRDGESTRVLVDPNKFSKDGTSAMSVWWPSRTGDRVAFGIAVAGSDWMEARFRDTATGKELPDRLNWMKNSALVWSHKEDGIYYSRFPEPKPEEKLTAPNYHSKVYFHKLGTPQSDDKLVYETPDEPEWRHNVRLAADDRFLLIFTTKGAAENLISVIDRSKPEPKARPITEGYTSSTRLMGTRGSTAYFITDDRAPKGRVVAVDLTKPERTAWREIVPEGTDLLENADLAGSRIVCVYLRDVASKVRVMNLDGAEASDIALPGLGTITMGRADEASEEWLYTFAGFTAPPQIFRYRFETGISTPLTETKLPFNPDQFRVEQVFYRSKDGTRVPMFLITKSGWKPDGETRTLLFGYGGFNIPTKPAYNASNLLWVARGGVMAIANLRGGGEYGREWHRAGTRERKQNVFDDFIAAAEWLIANRYTNPRRLAIRGGSNGGLLVGAVLNQRPELFGAAVPQVGVMDMLRFHKFTVGAGWRADYGDPDVAEDFAFISRYSPIHNLRKGVEYPPTLVTTADHDDRVVPAHSFKYAAALQAAQEGRNPILIRIETSAGHGAGKPLAKRVEEGADVLAFLEWVLR